MPLEDTTRMFSRPYGYLYQETPRAPASWEGRKGILVLLCENRDIDYANPLDNPDKSNLHFLYKSIDLNICQFSFVFIPFVFNTSQVNKCIGVLLEPSSQQVAFGWTTVLTSVLTVREGWWRGEKEYKQGDRESTRHHMNTSVGYLPSFTFL